MANEKILVVEDERPIAKLLKYNLEKEGYRALAAFDGEEGLRLFEKENPDLIILDIMLPRMNGFEFCKAVRRDSRVPILMLTAKKEEMDRVLGLELGADDYVTKPFSVREVMARIKTILRRVKERGEPHGQVRAGGLEIDLERYETRVNGKTVALSSKEFEFLKYLIRAEGKALTREDILEKVWGYDRSLDLGTRTIDQHVARLREKLGAESVRIVTVKNVGYRIKLD